MKNCTIHTYPQHSEEWFTARAECFTASEFAPFFLGPKDARAKGARCKLIREKIREKLHRNGTVPYDHFELLDIAKERDLGKWNTDIARGTFMEQSARSLYEVMYGRKVHEVGFIRNSGGYGCSPDGLVGWDGENAEWGTEFKCVNPTTFLKHRLEPGTFAEAHKFQCHGSMVCCNLDRWDLFGFCDGFHPLRTVFVRDSFTVALEAGILGMVEEMDRTIADLVAKWKGEG